MLFQDGEASLEIKIPTYEFPPDGGEPDSDDLNWLVLRCTWTDGEGTIRKDSNGCLLTYELREMTAGLKVLHAGIRDVYESDFQAPGFSLAGRAEGDGFRIDVSFYLPNTMDGEDTAELSCRVTKEELKALTEELDALCRKFPDRLP